MPDRKGRDRPPRSRRSVALTVSGGVLTLIVVGVALVYFVVFPTSSPPRFALVKTSSTETGTTRAGSTIAIAGRWKVGGGSEAGYRVLEKLAFLPAQSQAVGRTSSITGAATLSGSNSAIKVTEASFVVNLGTLKSDRSMRDEKIRTIGLESDKYPLATFKLAKPIALPASIQTGQAVKVSATGELTIHGGTKTETIPLAMRVSASKIEAVGSISFPWSEFGMTAPSVGGFVNVTNSATMEFDLRLQRA